LATLALKLFLAPACVVAVSLAGRRWGSSVAGMLGGFPVVGGPILLVITLQHGGDFGADAAAASLLGLAASATFAVVYARLAPRVRPLPTLFAGWAAYFVAIALLDLPGAGAIVSFLIAAAAFETGRLLVPAHPGMAPPDSTPPRWDLPARALAALAMVLAITLAAGSLGPELSGLLAPFPILTSVLIVFTHAHHGADETQVLIRAFLLGFYGFATFSLVLALTLGDVATGPAFALALAAGGVMQLAMSMRSRWG
jgi:hypothetical protein